MDTTRRRILAGLAGLAGMGPLACTAPAVRREEGTTFQLTPIGHVEKDDAGARIRVLEPFADALLGLDGWSHVNVLYWFDRHDDPARRRVLRVHPRGDAGNPLTGVFACRAPVRPNLIALSVCRIVALDGPVLTLDGIDAFDGTPVLDLKPVIPADVAGEELRVPPWAQRRR